MTYRKIFKGTLLTQGTYSLLTAVWGLVDIESFMAVSGPKTDIWLVKTVSVLLIPISICFFLNIYIKTHPLPVSILACTTAFGLAAIDFYYSINGTISKVYMIDGVLEIIFLIIWIYLLIQIKKL